MGPNLFLSFKQVDVRQAEQAAALTIAEAKLVGRTASPRSAQASSEQLLATVQVHRPLPSIYPGCP